MKRALKVLLASAFCAVLPPGARAAEDPIRQSLVKIFTVARKPNWYQPWQMAAQVNSGGSGCVIEGNRIGRERIDDSPKSVDFYPGPGVRIVLDAAAAQAAGPGILGRYSIPEDRSPDLR